MYRHAIEAIEYMESINQEICEAYWSRSRCSPLFQESLWFMYPDLSVADEVYESKSMWNLWMRFSIVLLKSASHSLMMFTTNGCQYHHGYWLLNSVLVTSWMVPQLFTWRTWCPKNQNSSELSGPLRVPCCTWHQDTSSRSFGDFGGSCGVGLWPVPLQLNNL